MAPAAIKAWASEVRAGSNGGFQLNLWTPDPSPSRDAAAEDAVRAFLADWGPDAPREAADAAPPDFPAQCEAMLEAGPAVISSIMGLYPPAFVERMKARGIKWLAAATTVAEAKSAESAGADAIVAQGMEAGGHRGAFEASKAESGMVGLFSLLPAVVDAVELPVIAAGGVADARGVAAALMLGASAVQIGTGFLQVPRGEAAGRLGRRDRREPARGHAGHPRVLRPRRAQPCNRLRAGRRRARRAAAGALSGAARADPGDAQRRRQGQRHRPDPGLGRAIGASGAGAARHRRGA